MAVVFDNCCGCIGLRNACLISGYVKLVLAILIINISIVGIMYGDINMINANSHNDLHTRGLIIIIAFSMITEACLFQLIFTIVLLIGLHQNNRSHVKSYLIFAFVLLVIFIIGAVLNISLFFFSLNSICQHLIAFSLAVYNFMIIRSYYIKMGEDIKTAKECNLP